MEKELISIIVPCYNQAQYLHEAVESLLSQTYSNWECIIVNDGSTDDTDIVSKELCNKDERIRYFKIDNGGLSNARNYGISLAEGKYILPLDSDDFIGDNYLKLAVEEIQQDYTIKVVYCEAELFGEKTGRWKLPEFNIKLLATQNLIFCTALFRKEDWKRVGGYDTQMKYGLEDWEFWINILKDGGQVRKLAYTGFFYRIRNSSMIRTLQEEQNYYLENYIVRKYPYFFLDHIGNPLHLNRELNLYKESLNYITNKLPYRIYRKVKFLLKP